MTLAAAAVDRRARVRLGVVLGLALFVGSVATVDKYAGLAGVAVYLLAVAGVAWLFVDLLGQARRLLSERQAIGLALATLAVLAVLFAAVYPGANAQTPGQGSDRDDAADISSNALLHGRYPYAERTYLGNTVSQLPGGVLLAAPFEAIGRSALAVFCWLPLFFLMLRRLAGEARSPLLLVWLALALSPVLVREIVTGGDLLSNTVAVMLAAWAVIESLARSRRVPAALGAVALGLVLSWRLNFVFVLPPLLALVWRGHGGRPALGVAALTAASFALVTLPFWIGRGDDFTPIGASDKLEGFDGTIPGGARAVLLAGLALSVALALWLRSSTVRGVFGQTAVVQTFFLLAVVALTSARSGSLDLEPLVPGYGLPVVLLALGALASPLPAPSLRLRAAGSAA